MSVEFNIVTLTQFILRNVFLLYGVHLEMTETTNIHIAQNEAEPRRKKMRSNQNGKDRDLRDQIACSVISSWVGQRGWCTVGWRLGPDPKINVTVLMG